MCHLIWAWVWWCDEKFPAIKFELKREKEKKHTIFYINNMHILRWKFLRRCWKDHTSREYVRLRSVLLLLLLFIAIRNISTDTFLSSFLSLCLSILVILLLTFTVYLPSDAQLLVPLLFQALNLEITSSFCLYSPWNLKYFCILWFHHLNFDSFTFTTYLCVHRLYIQLPNECVCTDCSECSI